MSRTVTVGYIVLYKDGTANVEAMDVEFEDTASITICALHRRLAEIPKRPEVRTAALLYAHDHKTNIHLNSFNACAGRCNCGE